MNHIHISASLTCALVQPNIRNAEHTSHRNSSVPQVDHAVVQGTFVAIVYRKLCDSRNKTHDYGLIYITILSVAKNSYN